MTLTLAGSVRNERDSERVEELRELSKKLGIERQVEFRINESWESLRDVLGGSGVGLHTMQDEHFGITLVEFQVNLSLLFLLSLWVQLTFFFVLSYRQRV